jgi:hypothetical protein
MFSKKCRQHLNNVNETALEHMWSAMKVAFKLQMLVPVCLIHSVVPCLFTKTATDTMRKIIDGRISSKES